MKTTLKLMKLMIKLTKMISGDRIDQVVLFDEVQPLAYDILHDMAGTDSSRHQLLAKELPWVFSFTKTEEAK
jgi:hypothetical protein